jgi:hypothetical protein
MMLFLCVAWTALIINEVTSNLVLSLVIHPLE